MLHTVVHFFLGQSILVVTLYNKTKQLDLEFNACKNVHYAVTVRNSSKTHS